jgi:hypothetical protein
VAYPLLIVVWPSVVALDVSMACTKLPEGSMGGNPQHC